MPTIDRYVLQLFLKVFLIFFISLTGLYIVIDTFNNLDEFLSYAQTEGGLLAVLTDYYGPRVLTFFDLFAGMLMLVSAMFAITLLQKNNEMTALMAAGVSKVRIIRPVIVAVILLSAAAAANRELAIPRFREALSRNAQDWLGERARSLKPIYDQQTDILFQGKHTVAAEKRIEQPQLLLPVRMQAYGKEIAAASAFYQEPSDDRPGGYRLEELEGGEDLAALPSYRENGRTLIYLPQDTEWLEDDQCFVVSGITFEHLEGGAAWRQYSSTPQLIAALQNPSLDFGADARVTIHSRFVQPLLDINLLFLGLPLVLGRQTRNVFLAVGWCLLVVASFFILVVVCHSLGGNYLISPHFAAWCPLLVSAPVGVFMADALRR